MFFKLLQLFSYLLELGQASSISKSSQNNYQPPASHYKPAKPTPVYVPDQQQFQPSNTPQEFPKEEPLSPNELKQKAIEQIIRGY